MNSLSPHVVILPFPAHGHISPMLILAELLNQAGFTISFVNTEHCHRRILNLLDGSAFRRRCPEIEFLSIPDGLPPDHPRIGVYFSDLLSTIPTACEPALRSVIAEMRRAPSCIISDGLMSFANDVAEELGIPAITFRTDSAAACWTYFHFENLVKAGEIPVIQEDMDKLLSCNIPGLENILRRQDLPTICKLDPQGDVLKFFITQTSKMKKASALILNTFEELESPIISHLHSLFPTVYAIGPLHLALKSTAPYSTPFHSSGSSGQLQFDQSCIEWLDSQPPKSLLYVSFGTMAVISHDQLMEFWYGLINSEKPFLWAVRPELIGVDNGRAGVLEEVRVATMGRGRIVEYAPQADVLAHGAVGGFLTHSGWNSTMESICAGKPMICRPMIVEQPVNSRCVGEVWKIGLDMKGDCDRLTVEKMVRELMEGRREEIVKSTVEFARLAQNSVRVGGSAHANIQKLIRDIMLWNSNEKGLKVDNWV
ncbi:hypothetical protein ACS0TY_015863 [Phlomoides rotata]